MEEVKYPKGDLRRMLSVLGAIDAGERTLVLIAAATGLDKKTVVGLIAQAGEQAGVVLRKNGPEYIIDDWGMVIKGEGAQMALRGEAIAKPLRKGRRASSSKSAANDKANDKKEQEDDPLEQGGSRLSGW